MEQARHRVVPDGSRHLDVAGVYPSLESRYVRFVKPVTDRVVGLVFSIAVLVPLLVAIPLIWATMGRPALFIQERVGRGGRTFRVYKLRTMQPDRRVFAGTYGGEDRRVNHKSPQDPRLTGLGRFLRKWSIDELPQFWNVALGQMSLVGPRPELPAVIAAHYESWQHERHLVKPGITGLWQVSARGDEPMHERTELDIEYVARVSFWTDARILVRTVPAALGRNKGF